MVKFVLNHKKEILILLALVIGYFFLRLPNLTLQPIFADEAIYIRWAQVMRSEPTLRFLPLSDGKTPLFMWMMIPMLKIFDDPLFAGRFLSVLSGFFTFLGVFMLSWKVFSVRVGLFAAFIYVIAPYTVFFDRMALVDSMLASFTIWTVFIAVVLMGVVRIDLAMLLGYLLGGALLVKTPAMINLLILPVTLLGFDFKLKNKHSLLKLLLCWVIAFAIGIGIYNILRLGSGFTQISARNADYMFSPLDLVGRPLDPFIPHLRDIIDWFPKLLTWPLLIFIGIGVFNGVKSRNRSSLIILFWALIPLLTFMALLKTFTARYLLLSVPLLVSLAGFGLFCFVEYLKKYAKKYTWLILLVLLIPLHTSYLFITRPEDAPLPKAERRGYFEDWTAGYGFVEIAQFLIEQKKYGSVVVGTEGYFGTLPDGLQIYLDKSAIPIIGGQATVSAQIRESARDNQTFFVANEHRMRNKKEGLVLINRFLKAKPQDDNPQDAIVLYKVLP